MISADGCCCYTTNRARRPTLEPKCQRAGLLPAVALQLLPAVALQLAPSRQGYSRTLTLSKHRLFNATVLKHASSLRLRTPATPPRRPSDLVLRVIQPELLESSSSAESLAMAKRCELSARLTAPPHAAACLHGSADSVPQAICAMPAW